MTTQATTIRQGKQSKSGMVALVGATALTVAALGGAAIWGLRPSGETATPATVSTTAGVSEGVLPKGGLAEHYDERQRAATEAVTERGGMAEFYAEQYPEDQRAVVSSSEVQVTERGGIAEQLSDHEMWTRFGTSTASATAPERGGMAELYAEQAAAR